MSDTEPHAYSGRYAAEHGRFSVVPAAYVLLVDGERVLLQLRAHTGYYDGWWAASAAGHVEARESVFAAATREAREELGVDAASADLEPLTAMHRTAPTDRAIDQRVDFFFACRHWTGTPALQEDTAAELRWFPFDELPERVVHHERFVLDRWRAGTLDAISVFGF